MNVNTCGMKTSFNSLYKALSQIANQFDEAANASKYTLLNSLTKQALANHKALIQYNDLLIFLCAHPNNATLLGLAEAELKRISKFLKNKNTGDAETYTGSGLPHSTILTRFSHDLLIWLLEDKNYRVILDSYLEEEEHLNAILKLSLPVLERERTSAGLNNKDLLEALYIHEKEQLPFLLEQFSRFNGSPFLKDDLFDRLELYTLVQGKDHGFSRAFNRLKNQTTYFHQDLIKKFDSLALLNTGLPPAKALDAAATNDLSRIIKTSLVLMSRETDPASYMDLGSLRLFELERGISLAIYGMVPERQLPLESYVGYTLFKNGFPAAYGGCWVFGQKALFGINIFEAFRGGESGYVMCQILRVYRQVFGINYFEVEPYQFGKDNPDGIASGAYWFYHRYGFRSIDKEVHRLSEKEFEKIKNKKGYRSSKQTLEALAESYIGLKLGTHQKLSVNDISENFSALVKNKFKNKRLDAEAACIARFKSQVNLPEHLSAAETLAMTEMALIAGALNIQDKAAYDLLGEMVFAKVKDVYYYQQLLSEFLSLIKA